MYETYHFCTLFESYEVICSNLSIVVATGTIEIQYIYIRDIGGDIYNKYK